LIWRKAAEGCSIRYFNRSNQGGWNMRLLPTGATALLAAATLASMALPAQAQTCQSLWVERNSYYKAAGYCFRTPRAIRYFGNAGCRFDSESAVPLSQATRNRIAQITRAERSLGCSD
jgi:YARHG domain